MPSYNNPKKTNRYTNDFKIKAVQLSHLEGVQVKEIAEALDIHPFMLSRWRKEFREGKIKVYKRKKPPKPKPIKKIALSRGCLQSWKKSTKSSRFGFIIL